MIVEKDVNFKVSIGHSTVKFSKAQTKMLKAAINEPHVVYNAYGNSATHEVVVDLKGMRSLAWCFAGVGYEWIPYSKETNLTRKRVRLNLSGSNGVCYIGADLVRALGIEDHGSAMVSLEGNRRLMFKNGEHKRTQRVYARSLIEHRANAS